MTDITELAQRLKAAADREMICRDVAETSEIWERTVTPENILALVEALASEKRICATWRKTAEANSEKLEKAQQQMTESENRVRKQNRHICELFDDNTALRQRIAGLEARTVKLPDLRQIVSGDRYVWSDGVYSYSQDVKVALAAAGIKVEAE
ncbi:TPA: hypothetical protein PCL03_000722 [Klebsiella pneumoniae]|nr:hypothetical protein [Klebsiella pneumoniae]